MDESVEIAYEAVPEDFIGYVEHVALTGPFFLMQMKRARVFVTVIWPLVALLVILLARERLLTILLLIVVVIGMPITWFTWPRRWRSQVRAQALRQVSLENPLVISGPRRFVIEAEGVRYSTLYSGGYSKWAMISRISSDDKAAYLHLSQGQAYVIPRRAFAGAEEFDQFLVAADRFRRAALSIA